MKQCPSCKSMRSDDQFISKNGQREVKICANCREIQERYRVKNLTWNDQQIEELSRIASDMTCEQLAIHFNRTISSVRNKIFRHKIPHLKSNGELKFGFGLSPVSKNKNSIESLLSQSWV